MKKLIFTLISLLFMCTMLFSQEPQTYDDILCGKKPADTKAELAAEKLAHSQLEDLMPPVANQNPASWCFAFAAADALNYHNFLYSDGKLPNEFYKDDKMISPIELVYQARKYVHDHQKNQLITPIAIDTNEGGRTSDIYLGLNDTGWKARSLRLMPFESFDDKNPKAMANVQKLIEIYTKKNGEYKGNKTYNVFGISCPAPLYLDPDFKNKTEGFNQINQWLYKNAQSTSNLNSDYSIKNYKILAETKGPPDITTLPYQTNNYSGSDVASYLKLIRSTVNSGTQNARPFSVNVCSEDLESDKKLSTEDCNGHIMNIVGAYYKNGQCIIRIRNTWGSDWGDHGHVNLTIDEFLNTQEKYTKSLGLRDTFSGAWITPKSDTSKTSKGLMMNLVSDFDKRKVGKCIQTYTNNYNYSYQFTQFDEYTNNKMTNTKNYPLTDGKTFTGKVIDLGDGKIQIDSGFISKNGKLIEAVKYNIKGTIYSGPVQDDGGGRFHTTSSAK